MTGMSDWYQIGSHCHGLTGTSCSTRESAKSWAGEEQLQQYMLDLPNGKQLDGNGPGQTPG